MPVRRETLIDAGAEIVYEEARRLLRRHVEDGAFKVTEAAAGERWGIAWSGPLASSRYLFQFDEDAEGITHTQATLWLGGALGPVHHLLRRRGNRRHLDDMLKDLKAAAEAAEQALDDTEDSAEEGALNDAPEA